MMSTTDPSYDLVERGRFIDDDESFPPNSKIWQDPLATFAFSFLVAAIVSLPLLPPPSETEAKESF